MTLALAGTRVGAESDARLFAAHAPTRLSLNTTYQAKAITCPRVQGKSSPGRPHRPTLGA